MVLYWQSQGHHERPHTTEMRIPLIVMKKNNQRSGTTLPSPALFDSVAKKRSYCCPVFRHYLASRLLKIHLMSFNALLCRQQTVRATGTLTTFCAHVNLKKVLMDIWASGLWHGYFCFEVTILLLVAPLSACMLLCSLDDMTNMKNVAFGAVIRRRLTAEMLLAVLNVSLLIFQHQWQTCLGTVNVIKSYQKMTLHSIAE